VRKNELYNEETAGVAVCSPSFMACLLTGQEGKERKTMEGSLIWLLTVTVPTVIAVPGWSTTPFTEVGIAEEIASAIFCDLVRSAATESPEFICLKDDDDPGVVCLDDDDEDDWSWRAGRELDEFLSCRVDLDEYECDATTARESSAWTTTTKTTEAGGLEENWTNSCRGDLDEYESDDSIEILSEVGSVFIGTPSGSSSETLTTATSSEDGSCEGPKIEGPEIALEDAAKSKHLPKYGSRAKLRPETNEWT
jgi:hypothetical protein